MSVQFFGRPYVEATLLSVVVRPGQGRMTVGPLATYGVIKRREFVSVDPLSPAAWCSRSIRLLVRWPVGLWRHDVSRVG